jgi:hypothetical protein
MIKSGTYKKLDSCVVEVVFFAPTGPKENTIAKAGV